MEITDWRAYKAATDPKLKQAWMAKLLKDNEKFVIANVQRLIRRGLTSPMSSIAGVPLEDLIQAGMIGYVRALDKFDPTKGAFPTYAVHWIRHEVQQAAIQETTIRKPKDSGLPYSVIKKMDEVRTLHGREATAEELGITEDALDRWRTEAVVMSYQQKMAENVAGQAHGVGNENAHDTSNLGNLTTMADPDALNPEELLELKDLHGAVERLPAQERAVIKAMFFSEKPLTQILNEIGVPCSTLYEIRDAALARLREEV